MTTLDEGVLRFTVEGRLLRELGERLVRNAEVAVVELVKNAYDADATICTLMAGDAPMIVVSDDGTGMTLTQFSRGWMRIGTSAKQGHPNTPRFGRPVTGEKGIGRFAVRFLGQHLELITVADDPERGQRTRLSATFDWPEFDALEDLGAVDVPYILEQVSDEVPTGTHLQITRLRRAARSIDTRRVRTDSLALLSPLRPLLRDTQRSQGSGPDPGLQLLLGSADEDGPDVAEAVLENYALRAVLQLEDDRLKLQVFAPGRRKPALAINDRFGAQLGTVHSEIRFFPKRKGVFRDTGVDGRKAYTWIRENSGVAIFDRGFRVRPYGEEGDDWLTLTQDNASNRRDPRSSIAYKHFPMDESVRNSTAENWMLRLPQPLQLVGVVEVQGRRAQEATTGLVSEQDGDEGLVASADREGFVDNAAFRQLVDLVRGAAEALAHVDRMLQREAEEIQRQELLDRLQSETAAAIADVEANPAIPARDKRQIVQALGRAAEVAAEHEQATAERTRQLEVMSLLGVVAGFMTHEFGAALTNLTETHVLLGNLARTHPDLQGPTDALAERIRNLEEFVRYATAYIHASRRPVANSYRVVPRIRLICRTFGSYAEERQIDVAIDIPTDLTAPLVPTALYDGLALNLYSNALKAVSSSASSKESRIAFRAWNDRGHHYLEVADTGIGIPSVLRERVFDPLFTTTDRNRDALGSGMGLGLSVARQSARAFGGDVSVVDPPAGFVTAVRVRLPLRSEEP